MLYVTYTPGSCDTANASAAAAASVAAGWIKRNDNISAWLGGTIWAEEGEEKKCRHALRDFCWRRLRWLYTSIFVVVSYVYIEAKMCGNVRSFPPFMAGKQKQTSTAGRVATAAAAFTLPKMPFSSQQHSLMSSCRLPSDDAAAKVKLKLKGRRRRRCCHRNNLIINNIIIAVIIMVAAQTLSSTHTSPFTLAHTHPLTQCVFSVFIYFFFLF